MTGDMGKTAQRKAAENYRKRTRDKGLVRVEVQVPAGDAELVRDLAEKLKRNGFEAEAARGSLKTIVQPHSAPKTAHEIFASDLPDEYFEGVFDHVRTTSNRKIDW